METMKRNVISTIAYTPRPAAPISGMRQGWSAFGVTTDVITTTGKTAGGFTALAGPPDSASHLTV